MKFFRKELEENNLGSIVKKNTELYQKWMAGFETFKEEQLADGKEPNMREYFEQRIYTTKN